MAILWSIAWWFGIVVGVVIGVLVLVLIVVFIEGEIHYRFFYDEWKDRAIDEAELFDGDHAIQEMDEEGWSRDMRKQQCRADIESGWRRPASAWGIYGEEIFEEVRRDMKAANVVPGWRKRQKEFAKNR